MHTLKQILDTRFGGVIVAGTHKDRSGAACALELLSVKKGLPFTDDPILLGCFDFRYINDMNVDDVVRTTWMLPMLEAYEDSLAWSREKQAKVLKRIIISTVNKLIGALPGLPEEVVNQCQTAQTIQEARGAVESAADVLDGDSAAYSAAYAVLCAIDEDNYAFDPVSASDDLADVVSYLVLVLKYPTNIFITACKIWLEAVKDDT